MIYRASASRPAGDVIVWRRTLRWLHDMRRDLSGVTTTTTIRGRIGEDGMEWGGMRDVGRGVRRKW
jgi:hypothetical protein